MKAGVLACLVACVPSPDPLGETSWRTRLTDTFPAGTVGPGGHFAAVDETVELLAPDGRVAWRVACACMPSVLDDEGNVFTSTRETTSTLLRLAAADGSVAWSRSIGAFASDVGIDAAGASWWFVDGDAVVDFGGGPVPPSPTGSRYGRFAADGTYLASGVLERFVRGPLAPRPDGGFFALDARTHQAVAFDGEGHTVWHGERVLWGFAAHEDGELTLLEESTDGRPAYAIVRLAADHAERWRRHGVGSNPSITPLAGSRALVAHSDSLAGSVATDASSLELFEPDGDASREVFGAQVLEVFRGPPIDTYRFAERRTGPVEVVARRAP